MVESYLVVSTITLQTNCHGEENAVGELILVLIKGDHDFPPSEETNIPSP
jgi:hypothetical protein